MAQYLGTRLSSALRSLVSFPLSQVLLGMSSSVKSVYNSKSKPVRGLQLIPRLSAFLRLSICNNPRHVIFSSVLPLAFLLALTSKFFSGVWRWVAIAVSFLHVTKSNLNSICLPSGLHWQVSAFSAFFPLRFHVGKLTLIFILT